MLVLGRGERGGQARSIEQAIRAGCRGVISFGIAGGLAPGLEPGAWIVGSQIIDRAGRALPTCPNWSARLLEALPGAVHGPIVGSDGPVAHPAVKRLIHKRTGAAAVDMESHVAAEQAMNHGVPFVALRVVCDPAHRALPSAALAGMRDDGTTDGIAVLRGLVSRPSAFLGVMRAAADAAAARTVLEAGRLALGPSFQLVEEAIPQPPDAALPDLPAAGSQPA